jgi:CRISPR-associated protein Cas1
MNLFIDTLGAYIHVKDAMFEVSIPQENSIKKTLISPKKLTSILLSQGSTISHSVIKLAMINNIDIIFLENDGEPIGRVWHSKLGSTTKIRKNQLIASLNEIGVKYIKVWISTKLQNQIDFIKWLKKHRSEKALYLDEKIENIIQYLNEINELKGNTVQEISDSLRGYEGVAGRQYFETLSDVLSDEYKFNGRSSRPAKDQYNAFLNYSYGVLYSRIEKALIIAGIDPYIGFLHRDDYNQTSMVFDFIEPYRIFSDEVVFKLFSAKRVNKSHTDEIANGFTLNKEGKNILMESFLKFIDEDKILYKGRNQTRNNIIQFDAHHFANELINKKTDYKEFENYDLLGNV